MHDQTKAVHLGRHPELHQGVVNPPLYRASTILSENVEEWDKKRLDRTNNPDIVSYGLSGTPTKHWLQHALAELEGGYRTEMFPSGLAACTIPLVSYASAGDHVLMPDSVYFPTRRFCGQQLKRMQVETTYYDPLIGAGIAALMRPNTKIVFVESPGSLTFEVQDIPAIAEVAHARGAIVMMDNTWGTPLYFKPFTHGVDVSIQATTKYIGGHSDLIIGSVTTTKEAWHALHNTCTDYGITTSPDDCWLAARGLRSMPVRLKQHWESGLKLGEWLIAQPEVETVLHPAMPHDPGHTLWKRDFNGACGLFGVVLKASVKREAMNALIDGLEFFGIGASWGGFESLAIPMNPEQIRTATQWRYQGPCFRVHAGLEHPDDMIADFKQGFEKLRAANR